MRQRFNYSYGIDMHWKDLRALPEDHSALLAGIEQPGASDDT